MQPAKRKRFVIVLLKPSRYDNDGYVIQWHRSVVPCNTIATLYALAHDSIERKVLGDDVDIELIAHDETNTVLPIKSLIHKIHGMERCACHSVVQPSFVNAFCESSW